VAPGFNEAAFLALPLGSLQHEAVGRLGPPLDTWVRSGSGVEPNRTFWSYRERTDVFLGAKVATYHAVLGFSPEGHLVERDLEWYLD
jgi:hypothetical protein